MSPPTRQPMPFVRAPRDESCLDSIGKSMVFPPVDRPLLIGFAFGLSAL